MNDVVLVGEASTPTLSWTGWRSHYKSAARAAAVISCCSIALGGSAESLLEQLPGSVRRWA